MKEKKGKKGKNSLVDLDNFRSTRLKELARSLPVRQLGANGVSISTTSNSDLPPILKILVEDSIKICNVVGKYDKKTIGNNDYYIYDSSKLIHMDGGAGNLWYYYNNGVYSTFRDTIFGDVQGYLFIYKKLTTLKDDTICNECDEFLSYSSLCKTYDSNQGEIFGVVISSISQINALNKIFALNSNYLSFAINNALNSGNTTITSVINDIRSRNNDYTTPIFSLIPNAIAVITNDYIDIDLSTVNETSGDGNNLSAYKDFDISKLIKRENFVNNMGSIKFTEFMLTRYTSGINAFFLLQGGGESTLLGSLDQLDKPNSIGGLGLIRVRRETLGFGSLFGGYEGNRIGSFEIGFTQPYYEIQNQPYTSKRLSIKFRVIFK